MKNLFLYSIVGLLLHQHVFSADTNPLDISSDSRITRPETSSGVALMSKGGQVYSNDILLSHSEVLELFSDYPDIQELYSSGYNIRKPGKGLFISGIIASSGGFVLSSVSQVYQDFNGDSYADLLRTTGLTLAIIGTAMIPTAIVLKIVGGNKVSGSVSQYNQRQLKACNNPVVQYEFGFVPSGIGVRVRF